MIYYYIQCNSCKKKIAKNKASKNDGEYYCFKCMMRLIKKSSKK